MIEFKSPNKAKSLLKKALVNAVKTKNEDLISEINLLLASVLQQGTDDISKTTSL